MSSRTGMRPGVAKALGFTAERTPPKPNQCCGEDRTYWCDRIGRLVEGCVRCGRGKVYPGPPSLTREQLETRSFYGFGSRSDAGKARRVR